LKSEELILLAPRPKSLILTGGSFPCPPALAVEVMRYTDGEEAVVAAGLVLDRESSLQHPQAYRLEISPHGIRAEAATEAGRFYALMTLRQLLRRAGPRRSLPCCAIEDRPDFAVRGVMLDISRDRVPTMETILELVDLWAGLKLNQVQLYTEHTFAYTRHRRVWENASPFTGEEIAVLDAACRERCMELVPNQNSFGHLERFLQHSDYRHLAESPEGCVDFWGNRRPHPTSLYPGSPEALKFLCGLYDELLPHFSSRLFHAGMDEVFDLGQGRSREDCARRGTERVYLDFLLQVYQEVRLRGRRMLFWGDMMLRAPELLPELPRDIIAAVWGYEAGHPFAEQCRRFASAGLSFYVFPGTSSWNSLSGRWPNAHANLLAAGVEGSRCGASGYVITDWGDYGHWQQLPVSLPAYVYGSGVAWGPAENRDMDVAAVLSELLLLDKTERAAEALLGLGCAYLDAGVHLENASVLHALFADHGHRGYGRAVRRLKASGIRRAEARVRKALSALSKARIQAPRRRLLEEEIRFSARHLLHACALGKARLEAPDHAPEAIEAPARRTLAAELAPLLEDYRRLWLARSRPGGLRESAGRLESWLKLYREGERKETG
jgi:hexosaminidase